MARRGEEGVKRRSWMLGAATALLLVVAGAASATAEERVDVQVMVSQISDAEGPIDPRAKKLHEKLRKEFRYGSLEVLQSKRLTLTVNELGSLTLPNGRALQLRPLHVGDNGVLMAVNVEGSVQTDLRIRNQHLVVIGAERYREGKLVISLEPSF